MWACDLNHSINCAWIDARSKKTNDLLEMARPGRQLVLNELCDQVLKFFSPVVHEIGFFAPLIKELVSNISIMKFQAYYTKCPIFCFSRGSAVPVALLVWPGVLFYRR